MAKEFTDDDAALLKELGAEYGIERRKKHIR